MTERVRKDKRAHKWKTYKGERAPVGEWVSGTGSGKEKGPRVKWV